MSEVYLVVSRTDGSVVHVAFQTYMRSPITPGGPWRAAVGGGWERDASDVNIEFDLARFNRSWSQLGDPVMVSWRRLTLAEHEMFNQNRNHRDALEDVNGVLRHNMVKARELHRSLIRHSNGAKFLTIDREWVDAFAKGDKQTADAVEAQRQAMRDVVDDPRIEAAQTIEELLAVVPL